MIVPSAQQHLWRDVLWRATECVRFFGLFSKSEVGQLQVSVLADQNILWLQVAIKDVILMKVREC